MTIVIVMEHGLFLTMGLCRFFLHVCCMLELDFFKEQGFLKWMLKL
jgi:cytochrome c oxidase subunit IV